MSRPHRGVSRTVVLCIVTALTVLVTAGPATATAHGGAVLPPTAKPHGLSLTDMAVALAPFSTRGNDPAYFPDVPVLPLTADPDSFEEDTSGGGLLTSGSGAFTVRPGTALFVPLVYDAGPATLGEWPEDVAGARALFFGDDQYGGEGFAIIVDGRATPIDARYVAGPVVADLDPAAGTEFIQLGAFLHPLPPGTHTVRFVGRFVGPDIQAAGLAFYAVDFSYTVTVTRG